MAIYKTLVFEGPFVQANRLLPADDCRFGRALGQCPNIGCFTAIFPKRITRPARPRPISSGPSLSSVFVELITDSSLVGDV